MANARDHIRDTGKPFRQGYVLHGHRLLVLTLDLMGSPQEIEAQMLALPTQSGRKYGQENRVRVW